MTLRWLGQDQDPSELLRQLPSCYSQEFENCNMEFSASDREKRPPNLSDYCRPYYELWKSTPAPIWEAALESMPFCPTPTAPKRPAFFPLAAAGVVGLFLGLIIK